MPRKQIELRIELKDPEKEHMVLGPRVILNMLNLPVQLSELKKDRCIEGYEIVVWTLDEDSSGDGTVTGEGKVIDL